MNEPTQFGRYQVVRVLGRGFDIAHAPKTTVVDKQVR